MFQPQLYVAAMMLMLLSMLCWGSWANTLKLAKGWSFQAFYWDYVAGILASTLLIGTLLGGGRGFFLRLMQAATPSIALALAGGIVFNIANSLLVAAIEMAGMAVAFPIGIGLALVTGVILNYIQEPSGNPILLVLGIGLVLAAILLSAQAYRLRSTIIESSARGIAISVVAGLLMGLFYPFVARSLRGAHPLDAYTVSTFFALGVLLCALPLNALLMRRPLTDSVPVPWSAYTGAPSRWHLAGLLGGVIWAVGAEANFIASQARIVGPAVSYAIGQGATLISAMWGVFVWREFADAPAASKRLLAPMFLAFLLGLSAVAIAPLYR
ncbi:L-rhamnose-proton symporter [Acidisarcina polymorpha]|uniref:L-rhamnose-proton symporter n=1 Tax=Acidisarcina polymorpha TaxID=2211140 RepID=A0A2Z5G4B1_9BACT|nr:GRP family sugar transporter [Acidisarcina polymorpha]AXC13948.1 L-rhamnose-proton symporter [Acidisarcina polymorpha]